MCRISDFKPELHVYQPALQSQYTVSLSQMDYDRNALFAV